MTNHIQTYLMIFGKKKLEKKSIELKRKKPKSHTYCIRKVKRAVLVRTQKARKNETIEMHENKGKRKMRMSD